MNKKMWHRILIFAVLMLLQIAVIGNIDAFGYLTPYVYVILLFLLPYSYSVGVLMLCGFFIGLTIDIFSATGGLHAMACTLVVGVRNMGVTNILGVPEKELDTFSPLKNRDVKPFAMILLFFLMVFLHHVVLYVFEAMDWQLVLSAIWHALLNALVSAVTAIIIASLLYPSNKKNW